MPCRRLTPATNELARTTTQLRFSDQCIGRGLASHERRYVTDQFADEFQLFIGVVLERRVLDTILASRAAIDVDRSIMVL